MRRPVWSWGHAATLVLLWLRLCVSQGTGAQIRLGAVLVDGVVSTESGARGLQLLQEAVAANLSSPFRLSNGHTVQIGLELRNASAETEAETVYQAMATSGTDILIGLGDLSSQVMDGIAGIASLVGKPVIFNTWVHDALTSDQPYVFSVGLNNSLTMVEGLLAFKAALDNSSLAVPRPRVVVTVGFCSQDASCLALRSQCTAVAQSYNETFEVLGPFEFEDTDLAELVFSIKRMNPNLVVACVEKAKAVNLVFTSRALGFSPQGILVSEGTSQGFMRAVGAPNSNYIMSPVGWDPQRAGLSCRVFGDAAGFQSRFQARFGTSPDFYAASAAAAGLAALAAVEQAGQWPLSAQQFRDGLLGVSLSTFYRTLSFQTDGSLQNANSFTRQVLPLPSWYTPTARYTSSTSQQVDNNFNLPSFPMPSWQAKEVEVFPCAAGYVLDRTQVNLTCVPCAEGKQRPSFELECRPCTAGLYNLNIGQAMCTRCPIGAVCRGEGVLLPEAEVGYYRMPEFKDNVPFYKICKTGICSGGNQCYGGNAGLLCKQCKAGYTQAGFTFDGKNPACETCPGGFTSFVTFVLVMMWIVGVLSLIVHLALKSAISVRAVHSVILKIFGNYIHLVGTVALFTWMGEQPGVSLMVDLTLNPLSALAAGGCTLNGFGLPYYQLQTIIAFVMIPFAVGLIYLFHQVRLILDLRRLSAQGYSYREEDKELDPVQNPSRASTSSGGVEPQQDQRAVALKDMMMSRSRWTWVVIWALYPATVRKLLIVLTCQELDVLRLTVEPEVKCGQGAHLQWLIIGAVGIFGIGFGIPAVLFCKLRRVRDSLMEDDVRKTYGFLYNGLQPQYYYFEVGFMLRKVIFLLLGCIPSHVMRTIMMFFFSCIYLGVHIRCQPFDNRDFFLLDNLETAGLLSVLVTIAMNMMYEYDVYGEEPKLNDFLQSGNGRAAAAAVIVVSILINAYAWGLAIWGLLRDSIVKYTHFKAECMPNSVGLLGQLLLKAEPNMNAVRYSPNSHCLDLRRLTRRERMFLQRALCDTMEWYLDSGRPFHPGRLASCVCIAMELCIRERKARARKVALAVCGAAPKRPKTHMQRLIRVLTQAASRLWDKMFTTDEPEAPTVGRARLARGTKTIVREAVEKVSDPTAVIDELQNALMHCERSIMGKVDEKFFEIDVPPNMLAQAEATAEDPDAEGGPDGQAEKDKKLNANTLFGGGSHASQYRESRELQEQDPNLASDDKQISASSAAVGLDTKALLARHEDLKDEAKALRDQIAKLQETLAGVRQQENPVVPVEPPAELGETNQQEQNQNLKRSVEEDDLQRDLQELLGPGVKLDNRSPRREPPKTEPKPDPTLEKEDAANEQEVRLPVEATPSFSTWRYTPVNGASMAVRSLPKLDAPSAGSTLKPGQAFQVSEEKKGGEGGEEVTFLKLADGKGWVFDIKPGVGVMCRKVAD